MALAQVAGRERCHEEATHTAPGPAEPHGPRRCGGPEHSVGLSEGSVNSLTRTLRVRPDPEFLVPFAREANRTGTEINVKPVYKVTGFAVSVKRYG
jgi:hypothetical protein